MVNTYSWFSRSIVCLFLMLIWLCDRVRVYRQKKIIANLIVEWAGQLKEQDQKEHRCLDRKRIIIDRKYCSLMMCEKLHRMNIEVISVDHEFLYSEFEKQKESVDAVIIGTDSKSIKLAQAIRTASNQIQIYGASNQGDWDALVDVLDAGMNGTVCFPLDEKEISEMMNR